LDKIEIPNDRAFVACQRDGTGVLPGGRDHLWSCLIMVFSFPGVN
jgi:hypothetical protein